jgi:CDP-diacylglycerol--serine O-phosphatidyltransferase
LIDIVSFGICPAVFLLSYGNFSPWFLPGAFVIVAVGVIRLSYFNVFGLVDNSTYMGLALDNNVLILAFIFLFNSYFSQPVFTIAVYALLMIIAAFNVAPIRTPKFSSKWFSVLLIYVMGLTAIYI